VRRRRVFVRAQPAGPGSSRVQVGGLTRMDASGGFEEEFASLAAELRSAHDQDADNRQEGE
jgi:cytochrome c biogenesis protein ResB